MRVAGFATERRLYVSDKDRHQRLRHRQRTSCREIELPGTGDYKGIAASPQLGKLYITSFKGDVLICIDLLNDAVVWKKKYGKYADSMAITPDGQTMYLPFRDEDSWWVVNAADGAVKAKIQIGRGKN
jgi:DNA-binding beta-propeller fold protein YncE